MRLRSSTVDADNSLLIESLISGKWITKSSSLRNTPQKDEVTGRIKGLRPDNEPRLQVRSQIGCANEGLGAEEANMLLSAICPTYPSYVILV